MSPGGAAQAAAADPVPAASGRGSAARSIAGVVAWDAVYTDRGQYPLHMGERRRGSVAPV